MLGTWTSTGSPVGWVNQPRGIHRCGYLLLQLKELQLRSLLQFQLFWSSRILLSWSSKIVDCDFRISAFKVDGLHWSLHFIIPKLSDFILTESKPFSKSLYTCNRKRKKKKKKRPLLLLVTLILSLIICSQKYKKGRSGGGEKGREEPIERNCRERKDGKDGANWPMLEQLQLNSLF